MRGMTWAIACAAGLACTDAARADHFEVFAGCKHCPPTNPEFRAWLAG